MESKNTDRRKFLDKSLKIGLAALAGSFGLSKLSSKLIADNSRSSADKIELMTTDGKLIQVDSSEVIDIVHSEDSDKKYNVREGMPNRKFVMVVDLAKCKNALSCQSACNKAHYITG